MSVVGLGTPSEHYDVLICSYALYGPDGAKEGQAEGWSEEVRL